MKSNIQISSPAVNMLTSDLQVYMFKKPTCLATLAKSTIVSFDSLNTHPPFRLTVQREDLTISSSVVLIN